MQEITERKSKTRIKKEMIELQKTGERLVRLSPEQLDSIDMPDKLREAVMLARTLTRHGARHRQMQYLGVLMRSIDVGPIHKALADIDGGLKNRAAQFHLIEQWRDRLVGGSDELLEEVFTRFPDADRQRVRQLVHNARREKEANPAKSKSARALFRCLRELSENAAAEDHPENTD